jgi:hypothetical protein
LFYSAESEVKNIHSRIRKHNGDLPVGDWVRLPYQLKHPLFGYYTVALLIDVDPVGNARSLSVNAYPESH